MSKPSEPVYVVLKVPEETKGDTPLFLREAVTTHLIASADPLVRKMADSARLFKPDGLGIAFRAVLVKNRPETVAVEVALVASAMVAALKERLEK